MATTTDSRPLPQRGVIQQISGIFWRYPWLSLLLLLVAPLVWLLIFYIGPLLSMLVQSFYYIDDYSGVMIKQISPITYQALVSPTNLDIVIRTATMAACVTVACALIAFPLGYYMARYASNR